MNPILQAHAEFFSGVGKIVPLVLRHAGKVQEYGHPHFNILYGVYHGLDRKWWKIKTAVRNGK